MATQPCTLASTTAYRVYRLVLATQPCTLASTTGYTVYRLVLATQPCTLALTYHLQVYKQGGGYTVLTVQGFTPTGYIDQSAGYNDMTVSPATARQPSLVTPACQFFCAS